MRWMALTFGAVLFLVVPAWAQTTNQTPPPPKKTTQVTMPVPKAEPENGQNYPVILLPSTSPTETAADRGPAQKHFVLASKTDDLASQDDAETANTPRHENVDIDKRIKVPLIHDVQNDSTYETNGNHALQGEIDYLNWGAVTSEQLQARHGHYFTITVVNNGPPGDFVAQFQYRQVKSMAIVRTLTQDLPHFSGAARAYFGVVGLAYLSYGPVSSWRFTILKGDTVVAEAKSFLW